MRRALILAVATTAILVLAISASAQQTVSKRVDSVPHFGHVYLLVGENTSLSQDNARNAPYLVNHLKPQGAWLTNYFALHSGSLSDYIAMTSGQFQRCDVNDDFPYNVNTGRPACAQRVDNLFHQLDTAHIPWTEWNESMPNPCAFFDTGTDWGRDVYTTHHNPAVYYENIEGGRYSENFNQAPKPECVRRVIPTGSTGPDDTGAFNTALAKGHMARFNMVIPNGCEDSHDPCGNNPVRQFDLFLHREVPKIEASPAFGKDGVILITYDEWGDATPHNHRVVFLALGPQVKPGIYASGGPYTHYGLLRTIEDGFGISHHLLNAATARPINQIWNP
jgi:hypothetical protein